MAANQVLIDAIKSVQDLQASRVAMYKRFDEGFKNSLLQASDTAAYNTLVSNLTKDFSEISVKIIEAEAKIRPSKPEIADLIRTLQTHEKTKLQLTAVQHIKKVQVKELEDNEVFVEPLFAHELDSISKDLTSTVNQINDTLEELRYALADISGDE